MTTDEASLGPQAETVSRSPNKPFPLVCQVPGIVFPNHRKVYSIEALLQSLMLLCDAKIQFLQTIPSCAYMCVVV